MCAATKLTAVTFVRERHYRLGTQAKRLILPFAVVSVAGVGGQVATVPSA